MVKPIGYWTDFTPGDGSLLSDMEAAWGSNFEALNESEKAWMLCRIGNQLYMDAEGSLGDEFESISNRIRAELDNRSKLGLIQALVEQIKGS